MTSSARDSHRIVIAGASSLLGAELKSLLEESKFAGWDFQLLDEEEAAGTLTEAAGEAAIIQPVEEGSFDRARFVFFAGSAEFSQTNLPAARKSAAQIIDLSAASLAEADTQSWFPGYEKVWGAEVDREAALYQIPSVPAVAGTLLSHALGPLGLNWFTLVTFQPVSAAGRAGIEELESQTGQLLSFQKVGQPVFDTQVAFNMAANYGNSSRYKLRDVRAAIAEEIRLALPNPAVLPTVQVIHAPVFYGSAFSATAELREGLTVKAVSESCASAGFAVSAEGDPGPSNVSAAGENVIQLSLPERGAWTAQRWLFWGAADNLRFPAWSAVKLAERLA